MKKKSYYTLSGYTISPREQESVKELYDTVKANIHNCGIYSKKVFIPYYALYGKKEQLKKVAFFTNRKLDWQQIQLSKEEYDSLSHDYPEIWVRNGKVLKLFE